MVLGPELRTITWGAPGLAGAAQEPVVSTPHGRGGTLMVEAEGTGVCEVGRGGGGGSKEEERNTTGIEIGFSGSKS